MTSQLVDRVVRCAKHQTSPKQPDTVRRGTLVQILTRRERSESGQTRTIVSPEDVRAAIAEALSDGLLQADPDDEDRVFVPGADG